MALKSSRRTLNLLRQFNAHATEPHCSIRRPFICSSCQYALHQTSNPQTPSRGYNQLQVDPAYQRTFTTSPLRYKKTAAKKSSTKISNNQPSEHIPDNKATRNRDAEVDPYDFTELQAGIDLAISRLKQDLTKTRDAGRVTTEMLENLPIELNVKGGDSQGGSAHKEKTKIADIANVAPKGGRMLQVFAAEEGHVKSLISAIQASPYSLTPQPDTNNKLLILVPVPPATAETRAEAATEAKKVMEKASLVVQKARGDAQKQFRKMELNKMVIRDELRKAHKEMEDVVKKGQDEVKRVYESAVKALEK